MKHIRVNRIYNMDCVAGMQKIADSCIDLIVTSPPYDGIRDYNGFSIDLHMVGLEAHRVLVDGGMLIMVINDSTVDHGKTCTTYRTIVDYVDNIGFKLFENVIYSRHGRPGAWWNKRFRVDHEYILMFVKGAKPRYFDKEVTKIPAQTAGGIWHGTQRCTDGSLVPIKKTTQKYMKCRGTIWKYSASNTEGNKDKMKHPATFPDKLAEDLILTFSDINDIVLDPFMGSGTTARMCKKHSRYYIGFDISKEYCDLAKSML